MSLGRKPGRRTPPQAIARTPESRDAYRRSAPDVITPGEYPEIPDQVRQNIIDVIYRLTAELIQAGGESTETGQGILRTRAAVYRFYGQATGERPPFPDVETAASPLPEGSEEAAANERFVDGPVVDGPRESSGSGY